MGWFSRKARTTDDAFPFLSRDDADHLRRVAADAFARAGRRVTVHDDHLEGEDGAVFGLWNLAATCHEAGRRSAWPAIADRHVDQVVNLPDPAALTDEALLDVVMLRAVAPDQIPPEHRERFRHAVDVADGLLQILVADFPATVATLSDEDVDRVGRERMLAAGRARLVAEPVEHVSVDLDGGARLEMFGGESVYVASKVLVLEELLRGLHGERGYPDGVLVAVPDRQTLVLHVPVDAGVMTALQTMAGSTARMWATAPGGVSPSVYWWRGGALTRISRVDDDGGVAVDVHPELGDVLDRLAAA